VQDLFLFSVRDDVTERIVTTFVVDSGYTLVHSHHFHLTELSGRALVERLFCMSNECVGKLTGGSACVHVSLNRPREPEEEPYRWVGWGFSGLCTGGVIFFLRAITIIHPPSPALTSGDRRARLMKGPPLRG